MKCIKLTHCCVLQVDGKDLRNATHDQAVEIIRNASNPVRFVVQSLGDPACVSLLFFIWLYIFSKYLDW